MTQVEFENQLRELRSQKAQVMNQFSLMQNEVKEEIAAKNRQIYELSQQVQKLKVQKAGITERRLKAFWDCITKDKRHMQMYLDGDEMRYRNHVTAKNGKLKSVECYFVERRTLLTEKV